MTIPLIFLGKKLLGGTGRGGYPINGKNPPWSVWRALLGVCAHGILDYFMFLVCCYEACHYHRPSDDGRLRNSCKAVPSPTQTITTYPTSPSPSQYTIWEPFLGKIWNHLLLLLLIVVASQVTGDVIMIVINIAIVIIIMIILRHKWHPGYNSVPNNAAGAVFPAFIITIITYFVW